MNIGPEFLVALAGVLTALVTSGIALYNAWHVVHRDIVDTLQEEVERLTKRIVFLEQEKTTRDEQYEVLRQRVFGLEADNAALKLRVVSLETENNHLVKQNKELQQKVKAVEQSFKDRK